jgi:transposase-like protein
LNGKETLLSANTNRVFSREFKLSVAQRIAAGESVSALHHEFGIKRSVLYRWRDAYLREGAAGLNRTPGRPPGTPNRPGRVPPSKAPADPAAAKLAELERKVGQQALQIDFLRGAFKRVKELRQKNTGSGGTASTEKSGE